MPLLKLFNTGNGAMLGIWKMTEAPSIDKRLHDEARRKYRSASRVREYVCVRLLLRTMLGEDVEIEHQPDGEPFLVSDRRKLSISHTRGYCAVLVGNADCGVDIEQMSQRINKIASHFLRPDEHATTTLQRLYVWCAKETIYKLCPADHLTLEQMRIALPKRIPSPIHTDLNAQDILTDSLLLSHTISFRGEHLPRGEAFRISGWATDDFVITWCCRKGA